MKSAPRARTRPIRLGLLAAALLHIAGTVLLPVVHRHALPQPDSVWSADELPGRAAAHLQFCEACVAHGTMAMPASTTTAVVLPLTFTSTAAGTASFPTPKLVTRTRARAPPVT